MQKAFIIIPNMRIESVLPYYNFNTLQSPVNKVSDPVQPQNTGYYGPGVIVEISQQAKDASKAQSSSEVKGISEAMEIKECQTCKNRKYVDGSSDPSVSYQSPTHISPEQSASKVMAHEREHVTNEQSKAQKEDRKVVSQTVSLSTAICPECGKVYVSGGVTRTVTAADKNKFESQPEKDNS
jgi:ribosomal protein L32